MANKVLTRLPSLWWDYDLRETPMKRQNLKDTCDRYEALRGLYERSRLSLVSSACTRLQSACKAQKVYLTPDCHSHLKMCAILAAATACGCSDLQAAQITAVVKATPNHSDCCSRGFGDHCDNITDAVQHCSSQTSDSISIFLVSS